MPEGTSNQTTLKSCDCLKLFSGKAFLKVMTIPENHTRQVIAKCYSCQVWASLEENGSEKIGPTIGNALGFLPPKAVRAFWIPL